MAQTHTWFGTGTDAKMVVAWLREAGAVASDAELSESDFPTNGREFILHFPSVGPLEYWPDQIRLSDYPESSARWRQAVITTVRQRECPGVRQVDADRSAVAGLRVPELRDGQHWVSGCVWFPGSRLRDTFPELARICQRLERWVRRFPTVFDNTKGENTSRFGYQLCMSGCVRRVVALPEAHTLLERGAFMVDHMASPKFYGDFRRRLQLSGHVV
jgi:hypothetical protein